MVLYHLVYTGRGREIAATDLSVQHYLSYAGKQLLTGE